jgi:aryl-alcohol dehydrogenase-like predicted oxidoreductase
MIEKIELGTVQFGLDYGVNGGTRVTEVEVKKIVECFDNKMLTLDTSPAYGVSQNVLSKLKNPSVAVISKTLSLKSNTIFEVMEGIDNTCQLFGGNLYGIMIHDVNDISHNDFPRLIEKLENLRNIGIKIGVSIYSPEQFDQYKNKIKIDLVQVPLNLLDQRFDSKDFIESSKDVEIHVRSVFLQGLLLMEECKVPRELSKVLPLIRLIKKKAHQMNLEVYDLCLAYVFHKTWVNKVVIGLDNVYQAKQLIKSIQSLSEDNINFDLKYLAIDDENIINPVNWKYDN